MIILGEGVRRRLQVSSEDGPKVYRFAWTKKWSSWSEPDGATNIKVLFQVEAEWIRSFGIMCDSVCTR